MIQEHRLNIHYISTHRSTLKMFVIYSPILFKYLLALDLYRESSISDEEFALDVLMALKTNKNKLIYKLHKLFKINPITDSIEELINQTHEFLNKLQQELQIFNCYIDNNLPFNCLWLDGEDSLIFFRVTKDDV